MSDSATRGSGGYDQLYAHANPDFPLPQTSAAEIMVFSLGSFIQSASFDQSLVLPANWSNDVSFGTSGPDGHAEFDGNASFFALNAEPPPVTDVAVAAPTPPAGTVVAQGSESAASGVVGYTVTQIPIPIGPNGQMGAKYDYFYALTVLSGGTPVTKIEIPLLDTTGLTAIASVPGFRATVETPLSAHWAFASSGSDGKGAYETPGYVLTYTAVDAVFGIQPGSTLSGFGFTDQSAPSYGPFQLFGDDGSVSFIDPPLPGGSGSPGGSTPPGQGGATTVPEPSSLVLTVTALGLCAGARSRRRLVRLAAGY